MTRTLRLVAVCLLFALWFSTVRITFAGGVGCNGTPPWRLQVGEQARRPPGLDSNVRAEPNTRGDFIGQIPAGEIVDVLDGPVCADGYSWWKINYQGLVGWTPEGIGTDYWLEPLYAGLPATMTPIAPVPTLTPFTTDPQVPDNNGFTLDMDEPLIVFASESDQFANSTELFVMNPDGGNIRPLIRNMWAETPSWSADGLKILYVSAMGVTVLDTTSGETHFVSSDLGFSKFEWSSDSEHILISTQLNRGDAQNYIGDDEIFVVNADGSSLHNVTNTPELSELYPTWSPDGSKIMFVAFSITTLGQLFVMNADGSDPYPVATDARTVAHPVWSKDNIHIGLIQEQNVAILNLDDETVWSSGIQTDLPPVWSPDGDQLAFIGKGENDTLPQLYVVDAAGDNLRQITEDGVVYAPPSWSPDGQSLLFQTADMSIYSAELENETEWKLLGKSLQYPATAAWRPSL